MNLDALRQARIDNGVRHCYDIFEVFDLTQTQEI